MSTATIRTRDALRTRLAVERADRDATRVGLVPTMGALHEGHLSLIRAAAASCDIVVVSVFVNPNQFGAGEDLDHYPRDEDRDAVLATEAGADLIYAPAVGEVYPDGFATTVAVDPALTGVLCGDPARRGPGHFDGVTTVVAKLLNAVGPDVAYFGQKDAQQAIVIRRMVCDLELAVEIAVMPIVREPDGLALSSRNAYLSPAERAIAPALQRALRAAAARAGAGADPAAALDAAATVLAGAGAVELEYLEARDAADLRPVTGFTGRPVLIAIAAWIGTTRLIDNVVIDPVTATRAGNDAGASTRPALTTNLTTSRA